MSASGPPHGEETRRIAAAEWLVRLRSNEATENDWRAFEVWLGDPENKRAVDAVERAEADIEDHASEIAAALSAPKPATASVHRLPWRSRPATWVAAAGLALAAAAAIAVAPSLPILKSIGTTDATETIAYNAPPTATLAITFPDGSTATLNRAAALETAWTAGERRVSLIRGEAAFSVKHDPARPFVVASGDASIRDVGTEFNVQQHSHGLVVTVREGAVSVALTGDIVDVTAGHALSYDSRTSAALISQVNSDDAFAWRQNQLIFHDKTLSEIVDDMNRYADTPIRVVDPGVRALRFSGVLVIGTSVEMAEQLQGFLPVQATRVGEELVIRSR
jgi:transmembrane sensor